MRVWLNIFHDIKHCFRLFTEKDTADKPYNLKGSGEGFTSCNNLVARIMDIISYFLGKEKENERYYSMPYLRS